MHVSMEMSPHTLNLITTGSDVLLSVWGSPVVGTETLLFLCVQQFPTQKDQHRVKLTKLSVK